MSLKEEERKALVVLYWGKCEETLQDARCNREQKRWNATANRLYLCIISRYNSFVCQRWCSREFSQGAKIRFGKEYVLTGLATEAEGNNPNLFGFSLT